LFLEYLKLPRITKGEAGVLSIWLAVFDDRGALNKAVALGKARERPRTRVDGETRTEILVTA
jgi:hypothetical protein